MTIKKDIQWRVALVYVSLVLFGIAVLAKVVYLQFVEVGSLSKKAFQLSIKDLEIMPNRGDILACDGRLLATAVPYYDIRVDVSKYTIPREVFTQNIDSLALCISRLFKDKSANAYKLALVQARNTDNRYYLLKRKVDYIHLKKLKKFPLFKLGKNKGGLIPVQENVRFMPHGNLAARTIGYVSKSENYNIVGLEGAFDQQLTGTKGIKLMQRLAGNIWMPIADENEVEPKDGYDVVSTIDINIQDVAATALERQLRQHNAHHGCAMLMEVKTGAVKAIANLESDGKGNYHESFNYAIGESTEPGSTIKLATLMVAMEDGYTSLEDTIDTEKGNIQIYDKIIHDSEDEGHGKITVEQVFEMSSNIGVAKIVMEHYKGKERHFMDKIYSFGLHNKLGLDIKGEAEPYLNYPGNKLWSGISLPMIAHGYEIRLAPVHILAFYNAVANNGKFVKPRFVEELRYRGRVVKSFPPDVMISSICSASTIRKARKMMEGVVEEGTAINLKNPIYKIAGKTGTAQIAKGNKGYRQNTSISYQASFVGYFPANNPKYTCIVMVNAPSNGVYYGNVVAGPVFKEIADKVYASSFDLHDDILSGKKNLKTEAPYSKNGFWKEIEPTLDELGIPYNEINDQTDNWILTKHDSVEIKIANKKIINRLVPDCTGMGAKDAVFLIESSGMRALVSGWGKVTRQSVMPGSAIVQGGMVVFTLN